MSAEIEKAQGGPVTLIEGSKGIFDVKKDGKLIFSKYEVGRFPKEGEVAELLK